MSGTNSETDQPLGPDVRYKKITIDENGVEAVLAKGQELVVLMAEQLLEFLKASQAPNYIEMKLHDTEGQEVIVTIQKGGAQTPADQIKLLKERITELESQLEDAHYDALESAEKADLD